MISKTTSDILDQLIDVIRQIDSKDYSRPLGLYNGSTLGKHFRHIHDFYACLVHGSKIQNVDYCKRQRVERLEIDPNSIISSLEALRSELSALDPAIAVKVYSDFEDEEGNRCISQSTIGREMLYAYDHAVHHLAIIKLGIKAECPNIEINDTIGVAASTLRHQLSHT